jgi:hypothetical protein
MKSILPRTLSLLLRLSGVFLFGWMLGFTPVFAQSIGVSFSNPQSVFLQDTQLYYLDSLRLNYGLKNIGNQPLLDTAFIHIQVLDSAGTETYQGILDQFVLNLPSGDTTQRITSTLEVTQNRFAAGGGVVVIWPSTPSQGGSNDTVKIPIVVSFPLSQEKAFRDESQFFLYPNPSSHQIYLPDFCRDRSSTRVLIRDVQGKVRLTGIPDEQNALQVSQLPPGIYFVEVYCDGHSHSVYRMIKV